MNLKRISLYIRDDKKSNNNLSIETVSPLA